MLLLNILESEGFITTIIFTLVSSLFNAGIFYRIAKDKMNKVEEQEIKIRTLFEKFDSMNNKIILVEKDSEAIKYSIHKINTEFVTLKADLSKRFENSDRHQTVTIMMIERLCVANNIDTGLSTFLLNRD